jgi:hypothetical protein
MAALRASHPLHVARERFSRLCLPFGRAGAEGICADRQVRPVLLGGSDGEDDHTLSSYDPAFVAS